MTAENEFIVEELTEMVERYNNPNFKIVIHTLIGAITNEQDGLLAENVRNLVIKVLLPDLQRQKEAREALNN